MAVRPIDAGILQDNLTDIYGDGNGLVYLKDVLGLIDEQPTLTPPNELMEALEAIDNAAVAYIEGGPYENDLPGLELAMEIDRLSRDFVQANRDGRCVVLPCKIGETLWCINNYGEVEETVAVGFLIEKESVCIYYREKMSSEYYNAPIGKVLFLTREAAEEALKGENHD